jgi:DNA-binding transcriptional ArsR family regulator
MKDLNEAVGILKALGHPARLQIVSILRHGEACVCHLEAHLGYRQPYISQQIMVLRKAGLLAERRDGTFMFYRLADPRTVKLLDTLLPELAADQGLDSNRRVTCSCPHCGPVVEAHT